MNQQQRTISALLRSPWAIEEGYALAHEPLINAYLSGQYPQAAAEQDGTDEIRKPFAVTATDYLAFQANPNTAVSRFALDDPNLPDDSVLVIPVQGPMFKMGMCGALGTLDYATLTRQGYAAEKIIGIVYDVDCPGGQIAGVRTLYDAVADPQKPTVSVIREGVMASAALWAFSPSDYIMASQRTDQIGSIGTMMRIRDSSQADAKMGIRSFSVYSDRSPQKNKPTRDLLDNGDDTALRADLNVAADIMHEDIINGRGGRIKNGKKGTEDDVFEGGMFYAGKAKERGLIDGFGDLGDAIAKVVELHEARKNGTATKPATGTVAPDSAPRAESTTMIPLAQSDTPTDSPVQGDTQPGESARATDNSNPNHTEEMPFGFINLPKVAALAGVTAADVTAQQIADANQELADKGYNVALVTEAQFASIDTLTTQLATANTSLTAVTAARDAATTSLTTATAEVTRLTAEVERLGKQDGAMGSQAPKDEESLAGNDSVTYISETDAELIRLKGGK